MKKLLILTVFFAGFSFSSLDAKTLQTDCHSYAQNACVEESQALGYQMSFSEYQQAYAFYYNGCVDSGGSINDPIFVLTP
ncbi:hypothetical protein [Mesonia aestuariivivens]|uniref:Uncharacterized protein n=1 Tax=Mesonia aestuariivivens TaxID=2796128 RepID=A0ABS6W379_9FLAO|nr:hypothetical protein [Mesonia aestuariivivens]MBW2961588.1 hypothetical protein [Mesonia aestuariivivens]